MPIPFVLFAFAAAPVQGAYPPDRFGAYLETIDGLRGPVDAIALPDGALLVVERDADRLTRIAADGERTRFGPDDLDAPEDVAALPDGKGFAVCDTGNDRVVLLDANGAVTGVVGERGDRPGQLRAPAGVASFAGDLVVADAGNGRVQVFALDSLEPFHVLGDLVRPVAVALAPDGDVYVLDAGAHQVVVFGDLQPRDAQLGDHGRRLRAFGDFGPHAGFLGHPRDLAIADGRVLVADADNHRVQAFDLEGNYVYEWGKHALRPREGEGSLHYPSGITVVGSGDESRALVCEAFGDRIQVFGRTGEDPALFMTDPGIIPWKVSPHYGPAISTAGDLLAIYEPETQTVLVHDLELDVPVEVNRFGAYGPLPGQHREISDVLVLPPGTTAGFEGHGWSVLVCDTAARGAVSWWALDHDPDAKLKMDPRMASFVRTLGVGAEQPLAIERAWDGGYAVADADGWVRTGAYDASVGHGPLDEPVDLEFDGELLWVVDRGARAVVALARNRDEPQRKDWMLERHRLDGFQRPRGVAVAADGEVYVTDEVAHVVRVFGPDESGAYAERRSFGGEGLGPGQLYRPAGIAIDARDRVIVLDHGNHRGMIFDRAGGFLLAFGPRGYVRPTER